MMDDFPYAQPLTGQPLTGQPLAGHAAPLAPRDERASLLVIADRMDMFDLEPVADAAGFRLPAAGRNHAGRRPGPARSPGAVRHGAALLP